jgi:membrane protein
VRPGSALYGGAIAGILWETSGILFTSFIGGSTSYAAIYSGLAILLVFMIWLYVGWIILLIGASITFYHQNPQQLKWKQENNHISGRMRDQLALQAMVNIARAHDQQSELLPSLENLAACQQVPVEVLRRILDALQGDGLIQQSKREPPHYIPGVSLQRIKLADILRSARQAEDDGRSERLQCDAVVNRLLRELDAELESHLAEQSLAELLQKFEEDTKHEDSLV